MKGLIYIYALLSLLSCGDSTEPGPDTESMELEYYDTLQHDGLDRTYFVHLPESYTTSASYPLLVAMHGGGILGYEGLEGQSKLSELSDTQDFIVVYPEGVRTLGFRTWNAGDCCPSATLLQTDDIGFIDALLGILQKELSINEKKIYAAGFSNGGQLAYKLANRFPGKFAAISAVAGVLQDFPFDPDRKVPVIHFHSYQDLTAPYNGGLSDAPNINLEFPSVESTLLAVANNYSCTVIKETIFTDPATYDHFRYGGCDQGATVELYVSHDGGHSWPGGKAFQSVPISSHFDASSLMWSFFQNYELP